MHSHNIIVDLDSDPAYIPKIIDFVESCHEEYNCPLAEVEIKTKADDILSLGEMFKRFYSYTNERDNMVDRVIGLMLVPSERITASELCSVLREYR